VSRPADVGGNGLEIETGRWSAADRDGRDRKAATVPDRHGDTADTRHVFAGAVGDTLRPDPHEFRFENRGVGDRARGPSLEPGRPRMAGEGHTSEQDLAHRGAVGRRRLGEVGGRALMPMAEDPFHEDHPPVT
jgi:hypothetical protein